MELWVRSQDKETLMKVNRIDVENNNVICYDNDYHCNETYMGLYKSKQRALEILDEIQNIIRAKYAISLDMKAALSKGISQKEAEKMLMQMAVYEMPEE